MRLLPDRGHQATEQEDLQTALERFEEMELRLPKLLARIRPWLPLQPGAQVLDVGAAQGVTIAAFRKAGFDARGVEPWRPAIEVSHELATRVGVELEIVEGVAESLPYEDGSFDFVHANSVLEHVVDPVKVFQEVHRVLRAGGGFLFTTTSALSPRQAEIGRFVFFPWYPPRLQRAIMDWAIANKPSLVGNAATPAYHWFKHRRVRRDLGSAGFDPVVDRWKMRREDERGRLGRVVVKAARSNRALRTLGDVVVPGMEYLALKPRP